MITPEQAAKLREPFPDKLIGKLPRRNKETGKIIQLDYVGHAAVTDRLLQVDPLWSWEPMAVDADGLPKLDNKGGMWVKLTICGVTRLGYGDETNGKGVKEVIGDAIRNAAMRFGVALDLWSKEDLLPRRDVETDLEKRTDERQGIDMEKLLARVEGCKTLDELFSLWKQLSKPERDAANDAKNLRKEELTNATVG